MPGSTQKTDRYKWVALSNTTLGVLVATIDISIMLIALPDIFRGIDIDSLAPGNSFYLLWMILSFMVVTSVLVVSLGRPAVLARLPAHQVAVLTGRSFFPSLISGPFASGLHTAFDFAIGACLAAAGMSWLRGGKYHYREEAKPPVPAQTSTA
jgi:hypothetical protein